MAIHYLSHVMLPAIDGVHYPCVDFLNRNLKGVRLRHVQPEQDDFLTGVLLQRIIWRKHPCAMVQHTKLHLALQLP